MRITHDGIFIYADGERVAVILKKSYNATIMDNFLEAIECEFISEEQCGHKDKIDCEYCGHTNSVLEEE